MPIAPELAHELEAYRKRCYQTREGWLFANPVTEKPYHQEEIQKKTHQARSQNSGHRNHGWLEDLPAQLSVVVGPNRSTDWSTARIDAPCQHSDNDECLRQGNDGRQAAGTRERGRNDMKPAVNPATKPEAEKPALLASVV